MLFRSVLGSRFLVLGSGRPRSQGARGSRFLVLGSRFGTPAHPGTRRIARMRAGTPALPGGTWFSVLGSWFSVRDARAPWVRVVLRYHGDGTGLVPGGFEGDRERYPENSLPLHPSALKCRVFGRNERCFAFPCAFAPHPPNPLLPQGEKGEFERSDGRNGRWHTGACQKTIPVSHPPAPCSHNTKGEGGTRRSDAPLHPHPFATCSRRNCANTIRPVWV